MKLCNSIYGMSISVMFLNFSCVVSPYLLLGDLQLLLTVLS